MEEQRTPTCRSWSQLELECAKLDSNNYDATEYGKQHKVVWSDYYHDIARDDPEQWKYIRDCFCDMIMKEADTTNWEIASAVFDYILDVNSDFSLSANIYDTKYISSTLIAWIVKAVGKETR